MRGGCKGIPLGLTSPKCVGSGAGGLGAPFLQPLSKSCGASVCFLGNRERKSLFRSRGGPGNGAHTDTHSRSRAAGPPTRRRLRQRLALGQRRPAGPGGGTTGWAESQAFQLRRGGRACAHGPAHRRPASARPFLPSPTPPGEPGRSGGGEGRGGAACGSPRGAGAGAAAQSRHADACYPIAPGGAVVWDAG